MTVRLELPKRERPWTEADRQVVAQKVAATIEARTRRGLDATGRPFRARADGSRSTLLDSGELLGSIEATFDGDRAIVRATADHASFVERDGRRFMGLTAQEQADIERDLREMIGESLGVE